MQKCKNRLHIQINVKIKLKEKNMKKLYLQKITQHEKTCYIGKIDPRELVRVATKIEMGDVQEAQRPLSEKRVKSIAKYVGEENGILPNTLTLATKDGKYQVYECPEFSNIYYIEFPSDEREFLDFKDSIDVMDGQHRLYSFLNDIRSISDNESFEMGFTLYIRPNLTEKRQIFISCNEKQEKVSGNLLMWFRAQLQMLTDNEKNFYNVVSKLNNEYPLKGKIIMSAEKITRGFKADQVMEILKTSHIQDLCIGERNLTEDEKVNVICTYLTAWEKVCDFSFVNSTAKQAGAAVKIAGFRFVMHLIQAVWDRAIVDRKRFEDSFCQDIIKRYISATGVEKEMFFLDDNHKMWFRDRTAIANYASEGVKIIKAMGAEDFNPLG